MTSPRPEATSGQVLDLRRRARAAISFSLLPDAAARQAAAGSLGIEAVRKLRFEGVLEPAGGDDWRLEAALGATVVQPCVVTLAPVTTRIDTRVTRLYLADYAEPEGEEVEMPEDDTVEPLPDRLDLSAVMLEALALALPDYPRAEGAELGEANFAGPGVTPMTDDEAKPLAGLAALRDRMRDGSDDESGD